MLEDPDRRRFLGLVAELSQRAGVEMHALVLRDNHYYRLLLRTGDANLSDAIGWRQLSYRGRCNWAHRLGGAVFQGCWQGGRSIAKNQPRHGDGGHG